MSRVHPGRKIDESDGLHHFEGFSPGAADSRRDDGEPDEVDGAPDAIGKQGLAANLL